ncbi:MAG: GIY-YIG nuclease family protein [candidate division NC10 bacterium]
MTPPVPATLAATLANLPDRPGVYLMKDARGGVLYVGKAQSLRNRVRSYWQKESPGGEVHRIRSVIDKVVDLEYTLTDSISEALLLEGNLIKRFQPQFNVRLKDDKSYPYIKVTLADDFPRIERTRKLPQDGSRYFGPYASASTEDEAMNLVRRLYPLDVGPGPCPVQNVLQDRRPVLGREGGHLDGEAPTPGGRRRTRKGDDAKPHRDHAGLEGVERLGRGR